MLKLFISIAFTSIATMSFAQSDNGKVEPMPEIIVGSPSGEFKNSCRVVFPNGMSDTAKCGSLVVVIDPRQTAQCAPRANLQKRGEEYLFYKNPKHAGERVTPCSDGTKVKS